MDAACNEAHSRTLESVVERRGLFGTESGNEVLRHFGDEDRVWRFFDGAEGGLAVDFGAFAEFADDVLAGAKLDPVGELVAAVALGRGCQEDHASARLHGLEGIEEGFVALNEIFCASCCGNNEVGAFVNGHEVHLCGQIAGGGVRFFHAADEDARDAASAVENGVDEQVHAAEGCGFGHVFGDGIAYAHADADGGVEAVFGGIEVARMVRCDGFDAGATGNDGFPASSETGEIMQHHGAGDDDGSRFDEEAIDVDRSAPGSRAKVDEPGSVVGFMGVNLSGEAVIEARAEYGSRFVGSGSSVGARGYEKAEVLVAGTVLAEPAEQGGQEMFDSRVAEGIGDDDDQRFSGRDVQAERGGEAAGRIECLAEGVGWVVNRLYGGNGDFSERVRPRRTRLQGHSVVINSDLHLAQAFPLLRNQKSKSSWSSGSLRCRMQTIHMALKARSSMVASIAVTRVG